MCRSLIAAGALSSGCARTPVPQMLPKTVDMGFRCCTTDTAHHLCRRLYKEVSDHDNSSSTWTQSSRGSQVSNHEFHDTSGQTRYKNHRGTSLLLLVAPDVSRELQ